MDNILPERIKELRITEGLTQKDFGESINVSTVSISSYETGIKTPSLDMILNIAQTYNISIDWLCGLSDNMTCENNITTYKDIFSLFIKILETTYENNESFIIDNINTETTSVILTFHEDENFQRFFGKWFKVFKLYHDGTVDIDLYKMWIEKQLKDYDRTINGCPF